MKKIYFFVILAFCANLFSAQVISSKKWTDLFSYNNVLAMKEDNGKIIAATENGIFYYTPATGEITKLSKANGLHEVKISAFDYNPSTKIGLVGYQNGSMDLITPDGITLIIDIPIATGFSGNKKINHISISGDKAVISVNYGISIFNLNTKEFAQSAFFLSGGVYEASNEATIKGNTVYSVTNSGMKTHDFNVTFPIYSSWVNTVSGNFNQIDSEGMVAFSSANSVYYENSGTFNQISQSFTNISDVVVTNQNIIVTDTKKIYIYNTSGSLQSTTTINENCNTGIMVGGEVYGGTQFSGIKNTKNEIFRPDGPFTNTSYKILLLDNKILVSTGNRNGRYNTAFIDPRNLGYYFYTGTEWIYSSYFKNNSIIFNVLDAVINPVNTNEVFFTNFTQQTGQGVYKMKYNATSKDFEFVKSYSTGTDVGLNRPIGLAYDDQNNLFGTLALFGTSTNIYTGIMAYDKVLDDFTYKSLNASYAVQHPIISENYIWVPLPRTSDIAAIDYKNTLTLSDDQVTIIPKAAGFAANSYGTISFAIDKSGDGWIGTDSGLRILSSANSSVKNSPKVEPIIIEQNGVAEELFRDSSILQIEVDSGNHKWISVEGGGAYLLSPNGEETLKHFTQENSPIPTNSITDIKVDQKTGKVYFVTLDGIVVYQSDVIDVTSNFGNVLVYPNPVIHANYKGNVTIRGLAMKTNIRITDATGNLVHQAVARGGYYEWDLNNQKGNRVASGIYFVLMTNEDGTDKATAKIAVVN